MKKILIWSLIISSIFLTSCWNNESIEDLESEISFYEKWEWDFFNDYSYIEETYQLLWKTKLITESDDYDISFSQRKFNLIELNSLTSLLSLYDEDWNIIVWDEATNIIKNRIIDRLERYNKERYLIELKEKDFIRKLLSSEWINFDWENWYNSSELYMESLIKSFVDKHKKESKKIFYDISDIEKDTKGMEDIKIFR